MPTVLLQYYLGEENSYLWVVTKDSFTSLTLHPSSTIKEAVANFREQTLDYFTFRDFYEVAIKKTSEANTQLSQLILPPEIFTFLSC